MGHVGYHSGRETQAGCLFQCDLSHGRYHLRFYGHGKFDIFFLHLTHVQL